MDSGELLAPSSPSFPREPAPSAGAPDAALEAHAPGPGGESAHDVAVQSRDPFGNPAHAAEPRPNLRGRLAGALAAAGALIVKFFSAIKGLLLLLPKLKLL